MDKNELLRERGLKCTKQRLNVFEVLSGANAPMTAEAIYERVDGMSLSTVYRTVEAFVEKGIASKFTIRNSDKLYYELTGDKHRHYAICLQCQQLQYVDVCPVHSPQLDNFTVTDHKLELYGYCAKCRKDRRL